MGFDRKVELRQEGVDGVAREAPKGTPTVRCAPASVPSDPQAALIMRLQQTAGNAAVGRMLARQSQHSSLTQHSSGGPGHAAFTPLAGPIQPLHGPVLARWQYRQNLPTVGTNRRSSGSFVLSRAELKWWDMPDSRRRDLPGFPRALVRAFSSSQEDTVHVHRGLRGRVQIWFRTHVHESESEGNDPDTWTDGFMTWELEADDYGVITAREVANGATFPQGAAAWSLGEPEVRTPPPSQNQLLLGLRLRGAVASAQRAQQGQTTNTVTGSGQETTSAGGPAPLPSTQTQGSGGWTGAHETTSGRTQSGTNQAGVFNFTIRAICPDPLPRPVQAAPAPRSVQLLHTSDPTALRPNFSFGSNQSLTLRDMSQFQQWIALMRGQIGNENNIWVAMRDRLVPITIVGWASENDRSGFRLTRRGRQYLINGRGYNTVNEGYSMERARIAAQLLRDRLGDEGVAIRLQSGGERGGDGPENRCVDIAINEREARRGVYEWLRRNRPDVVEGVPAPH